MNQLNISMFLSHAALKVPEKIFIREGEKYLTFARAERDACRMARVFENLSVVKGDRVALLLPNSIIYPVIHFAILKLGAVPVPLHAALRQHEISAFLKDSEAVLLITTGSLVIPAQEAFQELDLCRHLLVTDSDPEVPGIDINCHLETLMENVSDSFLEVVTEAQDPAAVLYTSGTVGEPKGAVLSHLNYYFFTQLLVHDLWEIKASDVIMMIAPPSHIFGQTMLSAACCAQAELTLLNTLTPKSFFQTIARDKVTFFAGVPVLGQLLLKAAMDSHFDFSSLKKVMFGGSAMPSGLAGEIEKRLSLDVITGYGMTEAVPLTFVTAAMDDVPENSVGRPVLGTNIKIIDEKGREVAVGETGEIVARGPQVFKGYLNRNEENEKVFRNRWLHTGDVGRRDEKGFYYIVDRLDDVIKTKGYKVYPSEVEKLLFSHPGVAEVAVVGGADITRGAEVKAFIVCQPETDVKIRDLVDLCKSNLADYKCPRSFVFVEALPKNSGGKILRKNLRFQENSAV